jgi:hypothetical protein
MVNFAMRRPYVMLTSPVRQVCDLQALGVVIMPQLVDFSSAAQCRFAADAASSTAHRYSDSAMDEAWQVRR